MCKRLLVLTCFALVLGMVGSASAVLNYEYYEAPAGAQYNALADVQFDVAMPVRTGVADPFQGQTDWIENAGGHRGDDFAFRFFGYIVIPVSGETTFYLRSDDGSQLFINGTMVINNDGNRGAAAFPGVSGVITLDAGAYTIEAIMYERGGGDDLYVNWSHGGYGARAVEDSVLFLEAPADISVVPPTVLVRLIAADPVPSDGAVELVDVASLEWSAGYGAVSHNVYLSADATIDDADLVGQTADLTQPAVVDPGVTYSWRIDEVDAAGNVVEGDVWSFSTLPLEAHFPSPPDGATNVMSGELSWTPGKDAFLHNVYFGTDPAALAQVSAMSPLTTFDPGVLEPGTTYYWQVDEFGPLGTITGPVWSFSTIGAVEVVDEPNLVAMYPLNEDASSLSALDVSGNDNHGALIGDLAFVDDPDMGQVLSLPGGSNQFVDIGAVGISGNMTKTIMCWAKADHTSIPDWTLIFGFTGQADGSGGNGSHFNIGSLGGPGGVGAHCWGWEETIFSDDEALEWHHYAMTYDGTTIQYYGDAVLMDTDPDKSNVQDLSASGDRVHIGSRVTQDSSFPGKVSDARIYSRVLTDEEIRQIGGDVAIAYNPDPADGASGLPGNTVLSWSPGDGAVEQDVYVGTDEAAVADANAADTTGIYRGRQAETTYAPDDLVYDATNYWRVDQVSVDGIATGTVWSFDVLPAIPMDNWTAAATGAGAAYLDTFVKNGPYDVGPLSGDITYEFIVRSNPDETSPSMALIGRHGHGDTRAALKYEQWPDTGTYGATVFGVADHDFGVATNPGVTTHLTFVSNEVAGATELYVNGALAGSVPTAITLAGVVGIGEAIRDPEGVGVVDPFDGDIFGVAIYDRALAAEEIAMNADLILLQLGDITAPGDTVQGVPNNGNWPGGEIPDLAIDDDTGTKYLHFDGATGPSGIQVQPAAGPTVVTGLALTTAKDSPERDPASFELSGSNDSLDGPYTVIASGDVVDFAQAAEWPRFTRNTTGIFFANDVAYKYYQVMFPTVRNPGGANSMQIAEIELIGVPAPVAHWTLDDGAGTVALDATGNGNDGTLEGDPQWVLGQVGSALDFDGDGDFVSTGKSASDLGIGGNGPRTVTAWVFTIGFGNGGIFDVGNRSTGQDFSLRTLDNVDNRWRIQYWGGDYDFTYDSKDKWVHFALVHDGAATKVYADGALIVDWAKTINTTDDNPFQIGLYGWPGNYFNGTIDDVQVYSQALSEGQIRKIAGL